MSKNDWDLQLPLVVNSSSSILGHELRGDSATISRPYPAVPSGGWEEFIRSLTDEEILDELGTTQSRYAL